MTGTIFDLVQEDLPSGQEGYMEVAKRAPQPKDDSFFNTISDYGKTILKGSIEGISRLGSMVGPLQDNKGRSQEQQAQEQEEKLNVLFPTDEGFVQSGLRRGLRMAPSMAAFPGSPVQALARSGLAGFAGEGAKSLGAPESVQSAAELSAFIGPNVFKKLIEKGKNKEIIQFARKMGMSDEQITPLLQQGFLSNWLAKISPKRGGVEKSLKSTQQGISNVYQKVQESEQAGANLSDKASVDLVNSFHKVFEDLPNAVRETIMPDVKDLFNGQITGKKLINFFKDINHNLSSKTKALSQLKDPVKKAISSISPDLAKDFEMTNQLYTKYYPIASKLKPSLVSDLVNAAENIGILGSLVTGNTYTLYGLLGEKAAKIIAGEMLTNPRFQQLASKTVEAINQNKYGLTIKLVDAFSSLLKKKAPIASKELEKLTEEELRNFLNPKERSEPEESL